VSISAPYDGIADWYQAWVGDQGDGLIAQDATNLLPSTLRGVYVLDVACGHGRAARALARRGARVVGVDLSTELIESARRAEADVALGVRYHVAEVSNVSSWWDGEPFDGAVCEMAVMDIDDFPGAVRTVRETVRQGGWFLISMLHPCFPGNEAGLSSWPPHGTYFDEGWWTSSEHNREGVRIRVGSSHRTFSTILNTLVDFGFTIERVVEPPAPVPTYLLIRSSRV
jgi:SAM-dependent methyltransferase